MSAERKGMPDSISRPRVYDLLAEPDYGALSHERARFESAHQRERRTLLWRLFVAGFGTLQVITYAVPAFLADGDMSGDVMRLVRLAGLLLTAPVMLWSAIPFYAGAWRELRSRRVGVDVPVAIGIVAAFGASIYATFAGGTEVYFDSVAIFVFLLLGARYLEMTARAHAARSQEHLAKLTAALAERIETEKPAIALLADKVARWSVAALLVLAAATAAVWYAIDPSRALWIAVALLLIACPCALSLATPAALTSATGALHRLGVLVARGHALETLAAATHFVFDKTGTLTQGRMGLIGVMPLAGEGRERCLELAAQLEASSEHPAGRAIVAAAGLAAPRDAVTRVVNVAGRGLEGYVGDRRLRIGAPGFVAELNHKPLPDELVFVSDEVTAIALGDEREFIALFTLGDPLRSHARLVVRELEALGKTVCVLSGDRSAAVARVARELDVGLARGDAAPQDKLEFVRRLQQQGAIVAMVGDGVNDAPVLAQAQVSVALGGGTRLAQGSADMVLASERLDALLDAVRVARAMRRVIRQNLAWAVVYNAVAVPLAVLGFVTPLIAAIGMSASSVMVVVNALRLLETGGRRGISLNRTAVRPA